MLNWIATLFIPSFSNHTLFSSLGYDCKPLGPINIISCWLLKDMDTFDLVGSISVFSLNAYKPLESDVARG